MGSYINTTNSSKIIITASKKTFEALQARMEAYRPTSTRVKALSYLILLVLTITCANSARILDEELLPPEPAIVPGLVGSVEEPVADLSQEAIPPTTGPKDVPPVVAPTVGPAAGPVSNGPSVITPIADPAATSTAPVARVSADLHHPFFFLMHDIFHRSNPQVQNKGKNLINGETTMPLVNDNQLQNHNLLFGTMTVIDDELLGHELGSGLVGKAHGFYLVSSKDSSSQTMALTATFDEGSSVDTLSFFGVYHIAVPESQLAIVGGTGKYVNAKGFATIKMNRTANQQITIDGAESLLEFTVYLS